MGACRLFLLFLGLFIWGQSWAFQHPQPEKAMHVPLQLVVHHQVGAFWLKGFSPSALKQFCELGPNKQAAIFQVFPAWEDQSDVSDYAMLGDVSCEGNSIVFSAPFPLQQGLSYRIVFRWTRSPEQESFDFDQKIRVPTQKKQPSNRVVQVYPSASHIPANLLKIYIEFSGSMSLDLARKHVRLLDEKGHVLSGAFLDLAEELWNKDRTRLTLLLDPGRIKRGLAPNLSDGQPLKAGYKVQLEIDAGWLDGSGATLIEGFEKIYHVVSEDRSKPQTSSWLWQYPRQNTREPLLVEFPESMDAALLKSGLVVLDDSGRALGGQIQLGNNEKQWHFTPEMPWLGKRYQLQVTGLLEDLAGNNFTRLFDEDITGDKSHQPAKAKTVTLRFKTLAR